MQLIPKPMTKNEEEHIVREWEKLNKEIEKLLAETRSREKYSITIIAGVAAWVLVDLKNDHQAALIVSCIPLITTILFGLSVFFLYLNIIWIGKYLAKIENYFLNVNPNGFGWEANFKSANKWHLFVFLSVVMWLVQLFFAYKFYCYVHGCQMF